MKPILPQVGKVYITKLFPGLSLEVLKVQPFPSLQPAGENSGLWSLHAGYSGFIAEYRLQFEGEELDPDDEIQTCTDDFWVACAFELAEPGDLDYVSSLSGDTIVLTDAARQRLEEVTAALDSTPQQVMDRLIGEYLTAGRWLCTPEPEMAADKEGDEFEEIPFWPMADSETSQP